MIKRIGIVAGREPSFTEALIARLRREPAIAAEMVEIGGTAERHVGRYDVVVDRLSPRVPHFRAYLKAVALAGATVINDPFRAGAADRFLALSLAARLGLSVPRTVLLPQKAYAPEIVPEHDLGNLEFPLKWEAIAHYVGFPATIRPLGGRGFWLVRDLGGLLGAFNASGESVLLLQQQVPGKHIRAVCAGERAVLLEFDPNRLGYVYHDDDGWLSAAARARAAESAVTIGRALGYDLWGVELVANGDEVWVIDADNPTPELHREAIGERHFDKLVDWLAEVAAGAARNPQKTADRQPWARLIGRGT